MKSIEEFRTSNVDSINLIQVIEVKSIFGDGIAKKGYSPIRQITEYFSTDGKLLGTVDNWKLRKLNTKEKS